MIVKRKYPWIGMQDWHDIYFLHWPVKKEVIRPYIPSPLNIDLFDGNAWVSIVFFRASNTRGRMMPKILRMPSFYQLNVRTYVYHEKDGERGVYFLNIYLEDIPFTFVGNKIFHLPFQQAKFTQVNEGQMEVSHIFSCEIDRTKEKVKDDLATFLTERYCIWNIKNKSVIKLPILHKKWTLNKAIVRSSKQQIFPFELDQKQIVSHYCPYKHSILFPYEKIVK